MDEMYQKDHYSQSLIRFLISHQPPRKVTKFLVSVSVFSLIFSYTSWCSFLPNSIKSYFSPMSFQFLSHALDKNCLFLICNGILMLIAKTSGMVGSKSGFDLQDMLQKKIGDGFQTVLGHAKDSSTEKVDFVESDEASGNAVIAEDQKDEEETDDQEARKDEDLTKEERENSNLNIVQDEEQEPQSGLIFYTDQGVDKEESASYTMEEEKEKRIEPETGFLFEQEQVDEEEEYDQSLHYLSTEDLNKKFEDFIRRMKEEIRIEARQQLVMVK